jgi:hypothetical protein
MQSLCCRTMPRMAGAGSEAASSTRSSLSIKRSMPAARAACRASAARCSRPDAYQRRRGGMRPNDTPQSPHSPGRTPRSGWIGECGDCGECFGRSELERSSFRTGLVVEEATLRPRSCEAPGDPRRAHRRDLHRGAPERGSNEKGLVPVAVAPVTFPSFPAIPEQRLSG